MLSFIPECRIDLLDWRDFPVSGFIDVLEVVSYIWIDSSGQQGHHALFIYSFINSYLHRKQYLLVLKLNSKTQENASRTLWNGACT